jgi:hypothetical protein
MREFEQLVEYIKQQSAQGIPAEQTRYTLLQHNWNAALVGRAFLSAKTPQKYTVFRALADVCRAIRNNTALFLLSVVLSYIAGAISLLFISFVINTLLYGEFGLLFASTSKLLTVLFGSLVLYTTWYVCAGAVVLAMTSLALYDGSESRKSSLASMLSRSVARIKRVIVADLLFSLVALWPAVLIIFVPLILLDRGSIYGSSSLVLPIALLAASTWLYVALTRFALAPYVALFEPDVPVTKVLGRSMHLLVKGGQWFLVKGALLLLLTFIIIAVATGQSLPELMDANDMIINIGLIFVSVVVNGALVMLYNNRKIVRG